MKRFSIFLFSEVKRPNSVSIDKKQKHFFVKVAKLIQWTLINSNLTRIMNLVGLPVVQDEISY
jgi:hypothetical protein